MRVLLACFLFLCSTVHSYKILCITSIPTKSHSIIGKGIVKSLLDGGHEVTWVAPYPQLESTKNLTVIDVSHILPNIAQIDFRNLKSVWSFLEIITTDTRKLSREILNPTLQKTMIETQFDAVLTELFFFNEFEAGYAAVQRVPWITLSGSTLEPFIQSKVDEANTVPILTMTFTDYIAPMNLWQRFVNAFIYLRMLLLCWLDQPANEAVYEKLFKPIAEARGVPLPPLSEVANNISILFVNSHPSFTDAISLPPNVVEIGGFHMEETISPLPNDLQQLMDSSPQGVVYFSMGSVIQSDTIPQDTIDKIIKLFGSLPQTVLWKFDKQMGNLPPNIHIREWVPQISVLTHPNMRVFISHGGILGQMESVSAGVPMIIVPVFADQPPNARRAERLGYAKALTFDFITLPQQLKQALEEIIGNEKYTNRAKEISHMFNKRPIPASKLISHYVELAIESKGAVHLRSKSLYYSWYQRWMLDVLAILLIIVCIVYKLIRLATTYVLVKFKKNKID